MKKLIAIFVLGAGIIAGVTPAQAHEGFRGYRGGYYGGCYGCGWVAPALIGGVIGYELSRPNTVYVEPQPSVVYVQPQPTVQAPPPGYHWQQMIDPQTNTQKIVLVPN